MASRSLPLLAAALISCWAAVDAASPACEAALVADCSVGVGSSACEVCTGSHQHDLRLAGCSAADAASFCATHGHPYPSCKHGLPGRGVCCSGTCGTCGGPDCGSHPGGAPACCAGKIEASQRS